MNIGCDIESVETFRDHWRKKKHAFFQRIFSPAEIEYCTTFKDPSSHFAARFCAKEAIVKAANPFNKLLVTDIQILHEKNGSPVAIQWKKRAESAKFFKAFKILISLSHTNEMGMACVLVQKKRG